MIRPRPSHQSVTPLASTTLRVTITDLIAEHVLHHRFENTGKNAIEAVFTFPVPLDAAFLGMRTTLAGETLEADIQPQRQADRTYGDAMAAGHSAVLLTAPEPGLLCTSLGNLLPGETGEIELRFATALRVADRQARFSLPLVHRPRYGRWNLDALEMPSHDFAVTHPLSATIHVTGLLVAAPVTCATHATRFVRQGGSLELSIGQAMLDRDLILNFDLDHDLAPTGRQIEDGDATLGLASFTLPCRHGPAHAMDLCLVLDGSGSMTGDAIEQSRKAVAAVIDALADGDRIQLLRFGSSIVPMFRRPLRATLRVREALRELLPTIQANLGGTDMGDALERALTELGTLDHQPAEGKRTRAIILVTDGAVQPADLAAAQAAAIHAGMRIFVVAVGSSAGAEVLEPLAAATGAIMERAVPAEPIDAGVMRHFRRAREASAAALQVRWPDRQATPIAMGIAYPGDAVNVAALLPRAVDGAVVIEAPTLDFSLHIPLGQRTAAPALRALLGQRRHRAASPVAREALALRYGLLTAETSAVLVKRRTEQDRVDGLPQVVQIPQMVSVGMLVADPAVDHPARRTTGASFACTLNQSLGDSGLDYLDMPAFLRRHADDTPGIGKDRKSATARIPAIPPAEARRVLLALYRALLSALAGEPTSSIDLPSIVDALPDDMHESTRQLLARCELSADNPDAGAALLLALNDVLDQPPLTDEQEAMLAMRLAEAADAAGGPFPVNDARMTEALRRAIR